MRILCEFQELRHRRHRLGDAAISPPELTDNENNAARPQALSGHRSQPLRKATLRDVLDDPIGYTDPAMDEEMSFPNPVVRTDLPTRRRRWPRIVMAMAVLCVMAIVFLPQILSSKVGRRFVVSYISSKTNCPVTLERFKTSWFGGTTVSFLTLYDPMNRHMGFKSLTCQASLWNLLRGKYRLGETVVEGLNVDYTIDDGRGGGSLKILRGPSGGSLISNLSGNITINSGTITLFRGAVQPGYFNTTWQQAKIENLDARFSIQSLDKPWSYSISADTVDDNGARGTLRSSGKVDPAAARCDVSLAGVDVRTGPLGAVLVPGVKADDVRQALGASFARMDIAIRQDQGKLVFDRCDIVGTRASFHLRPVIDLNVTPPLLTLETGASLSVGVSQRLARGVLVYFNPFIREAAPLGGSVEFRFDQARIPLSRNWARTAAARGRMKAASLVLDRSDAMGGNEAFPANLASQFALLTGDTDAQVPFFSDGWFSLADGVMSAAGVLTVIRDVTSVIDGTTDLESGAVDMTARLVTSPSITRHLQGGDASARILIPIGGTVYQPKLDVRNLRPGLTPPSLASLNTVYGRQIARMRVLESRRLMRKSQNEVEAILRSLRGPATEPAERKD